MLTCTLLKAGGGYETLRDVTLQASRKHGVEIVTKRGTFTDCVVSARLHATWVSAFSKGGTPCEHVQDLTFPLNLGLFPRGDIVFVSFTASADEPCPAFFLSFPPAAVIAPILSYTRLDVDAFLSFQAGLRTEHSSVPLHAWLARSIDQLWLNVTRIDEDASEQPYYFPQAQSDNEDETDVERWSAAEVVLTNRAVMAKSMRTAKSCRSVCTPSDCEYSSDSSSRVYETDSDAFSEEDVDSDDSGNGTDGPDDDADGVDVDEDVDTGEQVDELDNEDEGPADDDEKDEDMGDADDD